MKRLADDPTEGDSEPGRREQEWIGDQPGEEAEGAECLRSFADQVVGLLHRDLAAEIPADDDGAVQVGAAFSRAARVGEQSAVTWNRL